MLLSLEIPLFIRSGREKSRIVTLISTGFMSAAFGTFAGLNEPAGGLGRRMLAVFTSAALTVLVFLSYRISCRLMEKKEY